MDTFHLRMLAAALRRHIGNSSFEDLQQGLLDTFAGDIAGDGDVFGLAGDFVDFVDVDDADLSPFQIIVCRLIEAEQDIFHVIAHITGFGNGGGVANGKGNIKQSCKGLGQQGFSAAGRTEEQNVAFVEFHIVKEILVGIGMDSRLSLETLVVVVDRNRENAFCVILTDDIIIEDLFDFCWFWHDKFGDGTAFLFQLFFGLFCGDVEITGFQAISADPEIFVCTLCERHIGLLTFTGPAECTDETFFIVCHWNYFPSFGLLTTLSTRPYLTASSALMKKSRSVSFSIFRSGWPV